MSRGGTELAGIASFVQLLLDWFGKNGRDYPWRRTTDPYRVFVAECMLQRTTPGHVVAVYEEFLKRYPTPQAAASASDSDISGLLKHLGLKHRWPLFKKALDKIAGEYGGRIPDDADALVGLPGVGPYTARAVLCFAHGRDLALVDVNVVRVLERALGLRSGKKRPHTDQGFWKEVDGLVPTGRSREFNLALIDLAALICRRGVPKCLLCPVSRVCTYVEGGL